MQVYVGQSGDTLSGIAESFGTSVEALTEANPYFLFNPYFLLGSAFINPDLISPGIMLCVPEGPDVPAPPMQVYVVRPGDTLITIAQRFGTTVEDIIKFNKIVDPDLISPDQILCLPDVEMVMPVYQVQSGDTLIAIAQRFGSSVQTIAGINDMEKPDLISEGQILQIPLTIGTELRLASATSLETLAPLVRGAFIGNLSVGERLQADLADPVLLETPDGVQFQQLTVGTALADTVVELIGAQPASHDVSINLFPERVEPELQEFQGAFLEAGFLASTMVAIGETPFEEQLDDIIRVAASATPAG